MLKGRNATVCSILGLRHPIHGTVFPMLAVNCKIVWRVLAVRTNPLSGPFTCVPPHACQYALLALSPASFVFKIVAGGDEISAVLSWQGAGGCRFAIALDQQRNVELLHYPWFKPLSYTPYRQIQKSRTRRSCRDNTARVIVQTSSRSSSIERVGPRASSHWRNQALVPESDIVTAGQ